jgi:hypothetical protein
MEDMEANAEGNNKSVPENGIDAADSQESNMSDEEGNVDHEQGISDSALEAFNGLASSTMGNSRQIHGMQSFRDIMSRYKLRNIKQKISGSGFEDLDNTGTYDPDERETRVPKTRRPRRTNSDEEYPNGVKQLAKAPTYEDGRRAGKHMIVTLKLHSKEAKSRLAALEVENTMLEAEFADWAADDELSDAEEDFNDSAYGSQRRTREKTIASGNYERIGYRFHFIPCT